MNDKAGCIFCRIVEGLSPTSILLELKLKPDGLSLFQMNRTAGGQTVFHFHTHIVPRWSGDALIDPWVETLAPDTELDMDHREITSLS